MQNNRFKAQIILNPNISETEKLRLLGEVPEDRPELEQYLQETSPQRMADNDAGMVVGAMVPRNVGSSVNIGTNLARFEDRIQQRNVERKLDEADALIENIRLKDASKGATNPDYDPYSDPSNDIYMDPFKKINPEPNNEPITNPDYDPGLDPNSPKYYPTYDPTGFQLPETKEGELVRSAIEAYDERNRVALAQNKKIETNVRTPGYSGTDLPSDAVYTPDGKVIYPNTTTGRIRAQQTSPMEASLLAAGNAPQPVAPIETGPLGFQDIQEIQPLRSARTAELSGQPSRMPLSANARMNVYVRDYVSKLSPQAAEQIVRMDPNKMSRTQLAVYNYIKEYRVANPRKEMVRGTPEKAAPQTVVAGFETDDEQQMYDVQNAEMQAKDLSNKLSPTEVYGAPPDARIPVGRFDNPLPNPQQQDEAVGNFATVSGPGQASGPGAGRVRPNNATGDFNAAFPADNSLLQEAGEFGQVPIDTLPPRWDLDSKQQPKSESTADFTDAIAGAMDPSSGGGALGTPQKKANTPPPLDEVPKTAKTENIENEIAKIEASTGRPLVLEPEKTVGVPEPGKKDSPITDAELTENVFNMWNSGKGLEDSLDALGLEGDLRTVIRTNVRNAISSVGNKRSGGAGGGGGGGGGTPEGPQAGWVPTTRSSSYPDYPTTYDFDEKEVDRSLFGGTEQTSAIDYDPLKLNVTLGPSGERYSEKLTNTYTINKPTVDNTKEIAELILKFNKFKEAGDYDAAQATKRQIDELSSENASGNFQESKADDILDRVSKQQNISRDEAKYFLIKDGVIFNGKLYKGKEKEDASIDVNEYTMYSSTGRSDVNAHIDYLSLASGVHPAIVREKLDTGEGVVIPSKNEDGSNVFTKYTLRNGRLFAEAAKEVDPIALFQRDLWKLRKATGAKYRREAEMASSEEMYTLENAPKDQQRILNAYNLRNDEVKNLVNQTLAISNELATDKIDPNRWSKDRTIGNKLGAMAYIMSMGIMSGAQGIQAATSDLNTLMKQDIDNYRYSREDRYRIMNEMKALLPMVDIKFNSEKDALEAAQQVNKIKFISDVQKMRNEEWIRNNPNSRLTEEQSILLDERLAREKANAATLLQELASAHAGQISSNEKWQVNQGSGGSRRPDAFQLAQAVSAGRKQTLEGINLVRSLDSVSGQPGYIAGVGVSVGNTPAEREQNANETRAFMEASENVVAGLEMLENLSLSATRFNPEAAAAAASQANQIILQLKNVYGLGVLSDSDLAMLKQIIDNPQGWWKQRRRSAGRLAQLRKNVANMVKSRVKYWVEPGTTPGGGPSGAFSPF